MNVRQMAREMLPRRFVERLEQRRIGIRPTIPLHGGLTVAQAFVARQDYLSGVSVHISLYRGFQTCSLVFCIHAVPEGTDPGDLLAKASLLHEAEVRSDVLFQYDEYDFRFPAVPDSRDRTFLLTVSSPDGSAEGAMVAWITRCPDPSWGLRTFLVVQTEAARTTFRARMDEYLIATPRFSPPVSPHAVPEGILYSPVTRCNMDCIHCISRDTRKGVFRLPRQTERWLADRCRSGEIRRIAADYSGDIFFSDRLYGGIIDFLASLGAELFLDTNGICLTRDQAAKVLGSNLRRLNFSLDAATDRTYRSIRRGRAALSDVLSTLRMFSRARSRMRAHHVQLTLSFTLMKRNLDELLALLEIATEMDVDQVICRHLEVYTDDLEGESLFMEPDRFNEVRAQAIDEARRLGMSLHLPRPFELKRPLKGHRHCAMPWESAVLLGDGRVMACCIPATVMGSIHGQPFEEIWNGPVYRSFRATVNSEHPPEICRNCPIHRLENNPESYFLNRVLPGLADYRDVWSGSMGPRWR